MKKSLVFVYGSLKRGFSNFGILNGATFKGAHTTGVNYTMYSLGGFPGVVARGDTSIQGEVFEVDEAHMKALDRLEGVPSFYTRHIIQTSFGPAWMYMLSPEYIKRADLHNFPVVTGGRWTAGQKIERKPRLKSNDLKELL